MLASAKFGPPSSDHKQKLQAVAVQAKLDRLLIRLLNVDSWDALLKGR
jgi:hypothetical protein